MASIEVVRSERTTKLLINGIEIPDVMEYQLDQSEPDGPAILSMRIYVDKMIVRSDSGPGIINYYETARFFDADE